MLPHFAACQGDRFKNRLVDIYRCFDRMTMMIERRRNAIVREIARYRTEFSQQAQQAIEVAAAPEGAARGSVS
jgi:hypothetical protein